MNALKCDILLKGCNVQDCKQCQGYGGHTGSDVHGIRGAKYNHHIRSIIHCWYFNFSNVDGAIRKYLKDD